MLGPRTCHSMPIAPRPDGHLVASPHRRSRAGRLGPLVSAPAQLGAERDQDPSSDARASVTAHRTPWVAVTSREKVSSGAPVPSTRCVLSFDVQSNGQVEPRREIEPLGTAPGPAAHEASRRPTTPATTTDPRRLRTIGSVRCGRQRLNGPRQASPRRPVSPPGRDPSADRMDPSRVRPLGDLVGPGSRCAVVDPVPDR